MGSVAVVQNKLHGSGPAVVSEHKENVHFTFH